MWWPSSQLSVKCLPWWELLSDVMTSNHLIEFMNHHHTRLIRFRPSPRHMINSGWSWTGFFPISSNRQICGRLLLDDLFSNLLKTTLGSHAQTTTDIIYSYNKHKKRETTKLPTLYWSFQARQLLYRYKNYFLFLFSFQRRRSGQSWCVVAPPR